MILTNPPVIRSAKQADSSRLANLIHFEAYVHRHLDYRLPLDWIGKEPFLLMEEEGKIAATLACPPDPPNVAWIRLFAVATRLSPHQSWIALWEPAFEQLVRNEQIKHIAAIPIYPWFAALLKQSHFERTLSIVTMNLEITSLPDPPELDGVIIRPMALDDLGDVQAIDVASFSPVWANSLHYIEIAYRQAAVATVAEFNGKMAGYQISTPSSIGGHLARLAVLPELQGRGMGYALLYDLIYQFSRRGARVITVNTQENNPASIALYRRLGFERTGEEYPIYQLRNFF